MEQKRAPGRPEGKKYPVLTQLRLSEEHSQWLKEIARADRTSEAEAMRRLIFDEASKRGLLADQPEGERE